LEQGVERDRQRADVLRSAAMILATSPQHLDRAIKICGRAIEIAPNDSLNYLTLSQLKYQEGDATGAVEAVRLALQKSPSQPEALNNLAWILAENSAAYDEALVHARKAVALRPEDANFRDTLGFVLQKLGQWEPAREEFRRSVELAPDGSALRAKALFHLACVCYELGDHAASRGRLEEALAAENEGSVFSEQERAEINQLLAATQGKE
jgi:tetratricopeptide (TPR) repeat protein